MLSYREIQAEKEKLEEIFGLKDPRCEVKISLLHVKLINRASFQNDEEEPSYFRKFVAIDVVIKVVTPACSIYQAGTIDTIGEHIERDSIMDVTIDPDSLGITMLTEDQEIFESDESSRALMNYLELSYDDLKESESKFIYLDERMHAEKKARLIMSLMLDLINPTTQSPLRSSFANEKKESQITRIFQRANKVFPKLENLK
ncbi:hypothetical protein [Psychrobacter alimentarius]|uniref:hypothetical protein n=1 Tax=Psychrobacter alimentarius TaxID=261164 RepID=UPI003FD6437B